jgi:hypothetical protein
VNRNLNLFVFCEAVPFNPDDKLLLSGLLPTEASGERLRLLLGGNGGEIDWSAIARRANFHHTAALLRFNLIEAGLPDAAPPQFRSELDEVSRTWAARHLATVSETTRIVAALNGAGIEALPLKGAALMLGDYYPQAGLRAALDIDLLVDPAQIEIAERVAEDCGYVEIPGRRDARPRQRLANERNHSWPRRGSAGLILELHHRAFHFAKGERDCGFAELRARAAERQTGAGTPLLLPSPSDLALHLVHHTMVDWQSTQAILRSVADLHFIFAREGQAQEEMKRRARELGFAGAAELAIRVWRLLAEGTLEELDEAAGDGEIALLLDTALMESPTALAEAARLFEYFDFGSHPIRKFGDLLSLFFTSRSHLEQLYGAQSGGNIYFNYLRRPFDLMKRFNWSSLSPATLRRVRRLRRASLRDI